MNDGARTIRQRINELEQRAKSELGTEVGVYGVGKGYKALNSFLRGDRGLDNAVERQAHQYLVFLTILRVEADSSELSEDRILYCPESGLQAGVTPTIYVEPTLPVYSKQDLWNDQCGFTYLKRPSTEDHVHDTPDLMITNRGVDWLPWPAQRGSAVENISELMRWCGSGDIDKVVEELGLETRPSSFSECAQMVQTLGKQVDVNEEYNEWIEFSEKIRYLIECKHKPLTEADYSQILWYGVAYDRPLVIVSGQKIRNKKFRNDLEQLHSDTVVIDGFSLDTYSEKFVEQFRFIE